MIPDDLDRARFGPFEVDLRTHELWKFGTRLKLIGQPFEILAVLLRKAGELVTREELRSRLWPADTFVDFNHGLNAAVNKLRDALSDSADDPRYIETLPRRGYRFIAKVEWEARKAETSQTANVAVVSPTETIQPPAIETPAIQQVAEPDRQRSRPISRSRRLVPFAIAAVVVIAVVALWALFRATQIDGRASSSRSTVERTRPLLSIADTSEPAFSPDGNSVAFVRQHSSGGEPGIYVTPVGSDRLLQLTANDDDCCPVWSPDGKWIAFTRKQEGKYSIHMVPSDGGGDEKQKAEKNLTVFGGQTLRLSYSLSVDRTCDTGGIAPRRGEIDWSPDGKSIAFAGPDGLYLVDLNKTGARRLTESPGQSEDWGPRFSPDGRDLMFVRTSPIGKPEEIFTVPVSGGDARRILAEMGRIPSTPQWSFDGKSVIFSANRTGHPALWRASLDTPDSITQITEAGAPVWDPAISRRGYRLAYERLLRSLSIWQLDLNESNEKRPYLVVSSTSDTDQGPGPQFSPDGQRLAYMSDRTGTMEIWIANRDGGNAFQLTAVGGAGTPRWSPDSQAIAFDVATVDGSKVITMNLHGGGPQTITPEGHNVCPSWSHDGKWIYFGSTRSGSWQVWKVPVAGGTPTQITQHGGHAALESLDGKYLYYSENAQAEPRIWRVPVNGGEEIVMPLVRPGTWASFQVVQGGILFVGPSLGHQAVLSFYDFAKNRTTTVSVLERTPFWLGATPDGKTVAFDQPGREQDQAMLVENFR